MKYKLLATIRQLDSGVVVNISWSGGVMPAMPMPPAAPQPAPFGGTQPAPAMPAPPNPTEHAFNDLELAMAFVELKLKTENN